MQDQRTFKLQIIEHEKQIWLNTQYQLDLRVRIARRLKDDTDQLMKDLIRCETALDMLKEEIDNLLKEEPHVHRVPDQHRLSIG